MAEMRRACTRGRKMVSQKHLQQLRHREGFSSENGPKTSVSAAGESKKTLNPCALPRTLLVVPQPGEGQAQTCQRCFSLLDLQREREDGPGLQHPTPAWRSCRGMRTCRPAPE